MSGDKPDIAPGPVELPEVRAARRLADALDGGAPGNDAEAVAALEAAALIASAREPQLDAAARDRLADELFGPAEAATRPARRRFVPIAAAAAVLVAAAGGTALYRATGTRERTRTPEAAQLREDANALVAALLPPGSSPERRADAIALAARSRLAGFEGGTP